MGFVGAVGRRGSKNSTGNRRGHCVLVLLMTLLGPPFTRWGFPGTPTVMPRSNAHRRGTSGRPSLAGVTSTSLH